MYRPLKSFLLKQETSYLRVSCYNKKLVIPDRVFCVLQHVLSTFPYVSRSLIPVPLFICIEFYAVLFKRTSYLEGGRVICEAKTS